MSENTKLWDMLGRTDPAHVKKFKRAGGFEGTAIKPMWSFRRMTEQFGACGDGWGVNEPSFQVVPHQDEILVYCTASVWYRQDGEGDRHTVYGVGGDKVAGKNRNGLFTDDEAFKKAFTDAVTNALKLIGVGADVHMGLFDDSKYVAQMRQEFTAEDAPPKRQTGFRADGTRTAHSLRKDDVWQEFMREVEECKTLPALTKLAFEWSKKAENDKWPENWKDEAREEINKHRDHLRKTPAEDDFPGDMQSHEYVQNVGAM